MHIITVANRKGGVGKSSVTTHLAAALGIRGARILVIDMDSQASSTAMLLDELADGAPTTTQVLLGQARLESIIQSSTRDGVDIAPACAELTRAQFAIAGKTGRETILRRALRDLAYDVVLIDTAPELQLATLNALVAATHVLMPFTPDPKALEGLHTTAEAVTEIDAAELASPQLLGCVQVAYDRRLAVTDDSRRQVKDAYGDLLFETCIRSNSSFIVCPAWHRDIFAMERKERQRTRKASLISPEPVRDPHELVLQLTEEEYRALEHARHELQHGDVEISLEQMVHRVFADWMLRRSAAPEAPQPEPELLARLRTLIASPRRLLHELAGRMRRTLA